MKLLFTLWRRWNLRKVYRGDIAAMNRLYRFEDPWGLRSAGERFRFQETVRLIQANIGSHFRNILEIGCGEGLQTETLAPLAGEIVGVDASSRAVARARLRNVGNASFAVSDLMEAKRHFESRFQLVTACEILYYIEDLHRAFESLNSLGENCLVTYYQGAFQRLDPFFAREKDVKLETIQGADCLWRFVYWRRGQDSNASKLQYTSEVKMKPTRRRRI
jgi:SAM-dependent methyltransferase